MKLKRNIIFLLLTIVLAVIFVFRNEIHNKFIEITHKLPSNNTTQISVPFISQTGFNDLFISDWGCEEVSIIMLDRYKNTGKPLTNDLIKEEIYSLTEKEKSLFGSDKKQLDTKLIKKLAKETYNIYLEEEDFDISIIKNSIDSQKPILVPVRAEELGNPFYPNYTGYHTVIIVGYNSKNYIVHDPGTQKGMYYQYSFDTLRDSLYNLESKKKILILQ